MRVFIVKLLSLVLLFKLCYNSDVSIAFFLPSRLLSYFTGFNVLSITLEDTADMLFSFSVT